MLGTHVEQLATIIFPPPITMPTCPGLLDDVPGPELKNTRSPGCSLPLLTFTPKAHCSNVVRGIAIPTDRHAARKMLEQSHAPGPFAPNTYRLPRCAIACAMIISMSSLASAERRSS